MSGGKSLFAPSHAIVSFDDLKSALDGFLDSEQLSVIEKIRGELSHVLATQTIYRTRTEALCSVLNDIDFPTPAAKYHQCKREQLVMLEALIADALKYNRELARLQLLKAKLAKYEKEADDASDPLARDVALGHAAVIRADIDRCMFAISMLQHHAKDRVRELVMWSELKRSIVEDAKKHNEDFDADDRDTDQLVALTRKYTHLMALVLSGVIADSSSAANIRAQAITMLRECSRRGLLKKAGKEAEQMAKVLGISE